MKEMKASLAVHEKEKKKLTGLLTKQINEIGALRSNVKSEKLPSEFQQNNPLDGVKLEGANLLQACLTESDLAKMRQDIDSYNKKAASMIKAFKAFK